MSSKTGRMNFFVSIGIGLILLASQMQMAKAAIFSLELVNNAAYEGDPDSEIIVNVNGSDLSGPVTVSFTLQHISTTTKDVRLAAASVRLTPEEPSAVIPIEILNDYLVESPEDFTIKLNPIRGHQVDTTGWSLTIYDLDQLPVVDDLTDSIKDLGTELSLAARARGEGVLSYQWRKNKNPIPGQTADTLSFRQLQLSDAGEYDVVVSGLTGKTISNTSALIVVDSSTRWIEGTVGGSASMTIPLSAPAGTSFSWEKDGMELEDDVGILPRIAGASTRTLVVQRLTLEDVGYYTLSILSPDQTRRYQRQAQFVLHFSKSAPRLVEARFDVGYVGSNFFHNIAVFDSNEAAGTFAAEGLPAGLVLDPANGYITGIPQESVIDRVITITVTNQSGSDSQEALLTILPLPLSMVGTLQGWVEPLTDPEPDTKWGPLKNGARFEIQTTTSGLFSGRMITSK